MLGERQEDLLQCGLTQRVRFHVQLLLRPLHGAKQARPGRLAERNEQRQHSLTTLPEIEQHHRHCN